MTERRLGARQTFVKEISTEDADRFLEENHRNGSIAKKSSVTSLGLMLTADEDTAQDLLAVIQFCRPRTSLKMRKYSHELLRLAFKRDTRVAGGASKLIKHYIKNYRPSDFFTYQDTSGEATLVYEHAGMKFVSQEKKKEYLVAPGKTLENGSRKEILGMAYAVRYGPDRILGTKLGEVFDSSGKRKTNKAIFLEDLGWHIETTSGDRVFEWVDPNRTYYTYKITSSESSKYYYGVSHVKKARATQKDCLEDGYWGSGGPAMKHWKKKYSSGLKKEIIALYDRKMPAYLAESKLIESAWAKDKKNSLNFHPGGYNGGEGLRSPERKTLHCEKHGVTLHTFLSNGKVLCGKCVAAARTSIKLCSVHGLVKHSGDVCYTCYNQKSVYLKVCPQHGETKHQGSHCTKCVAQRVNAKKVCEIHGETNFKGDSCEKCVAQKRVYEAECPQHGWGKFQGSVCYKCIQKDHEVKKCAIHGMTLHAGSSCKKCGVGKSWTVEECPKHGETKFHAGACRKCRAEKSVTIKVCPTHGETKHRYTICYKCETEKRRMKRKGQ